MPIFTQREDKRRKGKRPYRKRRSEKAKNRQGKREKPTKATEAEKNKFSF